MPKITLNKDLSPNVPDNPIVPFVEGDGIGPDIWHAAQAVLDGAVRKAYGGQRKITWKEILAGEKAHKATGNWLPEESVEVIREHLVAIKGPLTTPVGGGIRSINVALRQVLDLYACVRPVRYFEGVPSPVKRPQGVDMVIFRENTEDVYAGFEWAGGTEHARRLTEILNREFGCKIRDGAGIGIKPMSEYATRRLVGRAIRYAIEQGRKSVTLVHKGNIMKFTEGAFRDWGYAEAAENFAAETIPEAELWEKHGGEPPGGKIVIKDRIADNMFQQVLLKPELYDVLAMPNLNGDYMSDALAAQVGGLGIAPGANFSQTTGVFEATHGTAPKYAGKDMVNPGSLILSGEMMLQHLGWREAADLVVQGMQRTIAGKTVTYDLAREIPGAAAVKCSEFGKAIVENM